MDAAWNSTFGGSWNGPGTGYLFQNSYQSMMAGIAYNNRHRSWGAAGGTVHSNMGDALTAYFGAAFASIFNDGFSAFSNSIGGAPNTLASVGTLRPTSRLLPASSIASYELQSIGEFPGGLPEIARSTGLLDITEKFNRQLRVTAAYFKEARKNLDANRMGASDRLLFFKEAIGHNKLFDIKQLGKGFHRDEIGLFSRYNGDTYFWTDYGNMNYGMAARIMGIGLETAKFFAGMQQVFGDGEGAIDWENTNGYFDQARDTRNIERGYNMLPPWTN
jgi:hypothetical protein